MSHWILRVLNTKYNTSIIFNLQFGLYRYVGFGLMFRVLLIPNITKYGDYTEIESGAILC